MIVEITVIYTSFGALWMLLLAYRVTTFRRKLQAGVGDKGDKKFTVAIRAHANFIEYAPITLLLLLLAEINGAPPVFLHCCGVAFILSRLSHSWGFIRANGGYSPFRLVSILANWIIIALLSLYNLF